MASGTERHSSNVLEKFSITVKMKDGKLEQREVEGYRISIPGCPEAKLFVHKAHDGQELWCVTEEVSGFMICTGASKPAAVGRARRKITDNYEKFSVAVKNAKAIRDSGKAPVEPEEPAEEQTEAKQVAQQPAPRPVKQAAKTKR